MMRTKSKLIISTYKILSN